ncbi:Putative nuclease, partial [Frankliniella fusca]
SRFINICFMGQILSAIGLYACGSYQRMLGRSADLNIGQATVCKFLKEVTDVFNTPQIVARYIHFPNTPAEREAEIERNDVLGLPRVLGLVDGTLVKIVPPKLSENREGYYCRKGYTALNALVVCNADLTIICINARYPGSCNDSFIFKNCGLREVMQTAYWSNHYWLLGDSGYAHEPWIQLPILNAEPGTPEDRYTKRHCQARNRVERCIGVMKNRWRCLLNDRTLHYSPQKAGEIVNACAVLHNFLKQHNVPDPEPVFVHEEDLFDNEEIPELPPAEQRVLAQQELGMIVNFVNQNP